MTDEKERDIQEVDIEFNDIGTEGGVSWDRNLRVNLRSSNAKDTIDELIIKANALIKQHKVEGKKK